MSNSHVNRRNILGTIAAGTTLALAGCTGNSSQTGSAEPLDPPVLGDTTAEIVVDVYEDYKCPHCQTFNQESFLILQDELISTGTIQYRHRDFPVIGNESIQVANIVRGVQDRLGNDAFWNVSKEFFDNQSQYSREFWESTIENEGGDAQIVTDGLNQVWSRTLNEDRNTAEELGVRGTPTVVINNQVVPQQTQLYADDIISYIDTL